MCDFNVPPAFSEPCNEYRIGSEERRKLQDAVASILASSPHEVPCVIDGKPIYTGQTSQQYFPSNHHKVLCRYHTADADLTERAIEGALAAKKAWDAVPFGEKVATWHRAAALFSGAWRYKIMAATMLGQGKNAWQAEIDAGAELPDFFRFGPEIVSKLYKQQPAMNDQGVWNRIEWRSLEGFVGVISPFNFTALAGNLVGTPLLVGNVTIWKPSDYSMLASYYVHQVLLLAGVPPSTVQFVPGRPEDVVPAMINHKHFAGLHFTGSSTIFTKLNMDIAANLPKYRNYPRVVGETGGKNFIIVHETADIESGVNNIIRAAFEYAGQKCSALSRLYVSKSAWEGGLKDRLLEEVSKITVGAETDWKHLVNAVIHRQAFERITRYISRAKEAGGEILIGGGSDDSIGYFIQPTIILSKDPKSVTMVEEIFGPVLTIYVFEDSAFEETLDIVDDTSIYALTGSILAEDRAALVYAEQKLKYAAGNFYLNDKCTAAAVGHQPFGGARGSGTNDKVASAGCFSRFITPRVIKENFNRLGSWTYPSNLA